MTGKDKEWVLSKRWLIIGAGKSGLGAANLLTDSGSPPIVYDDKTVNELSEAQIQCERIGCEYCFGSFKDDMCEKIDGIILSPGVSPTHELVRRTDDRGKPVISEIELAYHFTRAPIVAVTGTNGKTTTVHLCAEILRSGGMQPVMAGNIGYAFCEAITEEKDCQQDSVLVLEISSFQMERIRDFRPEIAVVLNITPDHMDRYDSLSHYAGAKRNIIRNQRRTDFAVINKDDEQCREIGESAKSRVTGFSVTRTLTSGAYLQGDELIVQMGEMRGSIGHRDHLPLPGMHNIENILAAAMIGLISGVRIETIAETVAHFRGVAHRIEFVEEVEGVRFFNDSKGTNLGSVEKALLSFDVPIVLIAGGRDKNAEWESMFELIRKKVKATVVMGECGEKIEHAWHDATDIVRVASMREAVNTAHQLASPGEIVLFSPGCASFDMYRNYEERGDDFKNLVKRIISGER